MDFDDVNIEHTQRICERRAEAVIKEIFKNFEGEREVNINGERVLIKTFYEPKLDPKERPETDSLYGKWSFGIDAWGLDNNWHLEFVMYQSGWSGAPVMAIKEVTQ